MNFFNSENFCKKLRFRIRQINSVPYKSEPFLKRFYLLEQPDWFCSGNVEDFLLNVWQEVQQAAPSLSYTAL